MSEVINELFALYGNKKITASTGVVTEIKGDTCTVEREGLPPLLDVRLQAVSGDFKSKFLVTPKIGSTVVCLSVDNQQAESCIVQCTEIEKIEIQTEGATLNIANGKFDIKNENSDLKSLLKELLMELKTAVIQTPSGVGKFSPMNKQKFEVLKEKTDKLFN